MGLSRSYGLLVGIVPGETVRADAVRESGLEIAVDIRLELGPGPLSVADVAAVGADGEDLLERPELRGGAFEGLARNARLLRQLPFALREPFLMPPQGDADGVRQHERDRDGRPMDGVELRVPHEEEDQPHPRDEQAGSELAPPMGRQHAVESDDQDDFDEVGRDQRRRPQEMDGQGEERGDIGEARDGAVEACLVAQARDTESENEEEGDHHHAEHDEHDEHDQSLGFMSRERDVHGGEDDRGCDQDGGQNGKLAPLVLEAEGVARGVRRRHCRAADFAAPGFGGGAFAPVCAPPAAPAGALVGSASTKPVSYPFALS